jgi:hypothetical protein
MIILALIIYFFVLYLIFRFKNKRYLELREQFHWKQLIYKMSGLITSFGITYLIILTITLTGKEKYLPNENAIYGIECSSTAKDIGFKDGDKIVTINNNYVVRFSDILKTILLESGEVIVEVNRENNIVKIAVTGYDKINLMKSRTLNHFQPRLIGDSISKNGTQAKLVFVESRNGIMKSFETFSTLTKYWSKIFTQNQSLGGFITVNIIDVKSFFFVLAISFILIGLVNFLPMPGFVIGNTIIAIIEIIRKKTFNDRKLKIIKISSLSVSLIIIALCVF